MASNIFRKGYQWPFHASRMLNFESSLIDLAVFRESQKGRRVFLDFNRNLLPVPGDDNFSLDRLDNDVQTYLTDAGAVQDLPIDRLRHMNPLSIELYKRYKVDITADPLEFAVNNQHMNGGIAVDTWGRTNIAGIYAVGEASGTHGATRPGGSALNAGQVFGTRVAEHIGASRRANVPANATLDNPVLTAVSQIKAVLATQSPNSIKDIRSEVQNRMSDHAGILCSANRVAKARQDAASLNRIIRQNGLSFSRDSEVARVVQWQQMALASEAVLAALDSYISEGGGSRGARAICDPEGSSLPEVRTGSLPDVRFRPERDVDKETQIVVRLVGETLEITTRTNRTFDADAKSVFERDWPAWLTGGIFDLKPEGDQPC